MTVAETLWEMPVAATAITRGPTFTPLAQRQCELAFYVETETGDEKVSLRFDGVEAYRCTYLTALTPDIITAAYGKIVDLGRSEWLLKIGERTSRNYSKAKKVPPDLKHLAICFDDGPSFEFICSGFKLPN
jgi:hypothetical protein